MTNFLNHEALKLLASIPPAWWFWGWVLAYSVGGVFLLWALSLIKNVFGWAGVAVAFVLVTYLFAYTRGTLHQPINPFDNPRIHVTEQVR